MDTGERLLQVKNDFIFANLFGVESHKRLLVCLLNSILNGKPPIKTVDLDRTEYKKTRKDGKTIRLDIAATSDDGTRLNVEIQCLNTGDLIDRIGFYEKSFLKEELNEGESYGTLPNIISIWIVGDSVNKRKSCVNEIVNMYKANGIDPIEVASEKMRRFVIELTKLDVMPKSYVSDMFSVWMQFIKDPASIPEEFLRIDEVNEAMEALKELSADKEIRDQYFARQKEINDMIAAKTNARKEGRDEKAIEVAKNLLKMGLSINQISQATGMKAEEIEKLG